MNRIVLEHYPASKLPKDMRGDIGSDASVRVVVEEEVPARPLTFEALTTIIANAREGKKSASTKEAVARIRALRDEWDD